MRSPPAQRLHGPSIILKPSTCMAKQASAKAICFSTTMVIISARDNAVGCQKCHQIIGIRRMMISADESPMSNGVDGTWFAPV